MTQAARLEEPRPKFSGERGGIRDSCRAWEGRERLWGEGPGRSWGSWGLEGTGGSGEPEQEEQGAPRLGTALQHMQKTHTGVCILVIFNPKPPSGFIGEKEGLDKCSGRG